MPKVQRSKQKLKKRKKKKHVSQNRRIVLDETQNIDLSKSPSLP